MTREISAVKGRQVVLLCTQTGFHKEALERAVPYLEAGQILLINPGYLSTAYALGHHKKKEHPSLDEVLSAEQETYEFIKSGWGK